MKHLVFFAAAFTAVAPALHAGWGDGKPWNDNRAEVAVYDAETVVDGKARQFKEQIITAREELRLDTFVKVAEKKGVKTIPAFGFTSVQRYELENFPVSAMVTIHMSAEAKPRLLKVTAATQEWNGNNFKILTAHEPEVGVLTWHSYRDGEDDETVTLPLQAGDVVDDALPLALRAMPLKDGFTKDIRVWNSFDSTHGGEPRVSSAVVTVEGEEIIRSRAGGLPSWKVTVTRPGPMVDTYWIEKNEPGILTRMDKADGRKRLLQGRARWPFWDKRIPRPNVLN